MSFLYRSPFLTVAACAALIMLGASFLVADSSPPDFKPVILDNSDARFVGDDWDGGESSKDKYGPDYRYHSSGEGSERAVYEPDLPASGLYEIYEWHPEGDNRTKKAEIIIKHYDGLGRVFVDQSRNGGKWNLIARLDLERGDARLEVTDDFPEGRGYVVMADAFMFKCVHTREGAKSGAGASVERDGSGASGRVKPFGHYVEEVIKELEARKSRERKYAGYLMKDKWGKYTGVTDTLYYKGRSYMWNEYEPGESTRFSSGGKRYYPYGKSYCSGLTLEIWHKAMKKRDRDLGVPEEKEDWNGLGVKGVVIFKKVWNVINLKYKDTGKRVTRRPSPATALELSGMGRVITYGDASRFDKVKKYDFCDISRSDGYGHSVVFINWVRSKKSGKIIGFRYYSTQKSTDGQGYNTEYFKGSGGKVLKSMFHAGRMYDHPSQYDKNRIREADYVVY